MCVWNVCIFHTITRKWTKIVKKVDSWKYSLLRVNYRETWISYGQAFRCFGKTSIADASPRNMDETLGDGSTISSPSILSKALQTTVLCPTFIANLLGNMYVCLAVARVRSLRQRPGTSILASLALYDFSLSSLLLLRLIWLYDNEAATKVYEFF